MLFVTWVADPFRPTRDLDLLGYGENSPKAIAEAPFARSRSPMTASFSTWTPSKPRRSVRKSSMAVSACARLPPLQAPAFPSRWT
ncbi:hypothetical protein [Mesorhizobium zhangyense]|uniref:hypothetical protein n=1 Tax=Mesorhizobium zhangyense TaxID=1776730 RepID=UPI0035E436B0